MRVLSVAEKPSVARELAHIIGAGRARRRNGYSPTSPVFEVDTCRVSGRDASMRITSVRGHLIELEFDESFKAWHSCRPEDLFTAPIKREIKADMQPIKRTLQEEARWCDTLMLWLDCDTEGENIAYQVMEVCTAVNPRINVLRAKFSALIPRDIMRTMEHPDRPNANMSAAVEARREIDLRLGAVFTRFQTLRLQAKFEDLNGSLLSYGPCQFPTLGFVVERYLKIQRFKPGNTRLQLLAFFEVYEITEDFWSISCELETNDPDERSGVLVTRFRPTTKRRPVPLNTIELQKRASRFLNMSSDDTMKVAEALYQRGILSYPRTETDVFPQGFELQPLIEDQRQHPLWGGYVSTLLDNNRFQWPGNGGHDDQAHPPIHPTKCIAPDMLGDDTERKLYELITRHFIACCSQDARGSQTTIRARLPFEEGEGFQATGLMVLERNWLDVYQPWEKWVGNKVAPLQIGDTFTPTRLELTEGHTTPPQLLSESDLIAEMDRHGIGTDATIAQHITTIQDRNYAFKDHQQRFAPTERGIGLVEGYNDMGYQLNKPFLRASMEHDCQMITRGQLNKDDMIKNCLDQMKTCFMTCSREAHKLDSAMAKYFRGLGQGPPAMYSILQHGLSTCGVCHQEMDLREQRGGNMSNNSGGGGNATRFLFCATCQQSYTMPRKGDLSRGPRFCPICNFQVLSVRNRESGRDHTLCPKCFSDPPGPPYSTESSSEFRCFMCAHPDCELAGKKDGDVVVGPCYEQHCNGELKLRRNEKNNSICCGCSKYPTCKATWWLPKAVRKATVSPDDTCPRCSAVSGDKGPVRRLRITVNISMVPPGSCEPESIACPCCSDLWPHLHQDPMRCPRGAQQQHTGRSGGYRSQPSTGNGRVYANTGGGDRRFPESNEVGVGSREEIGSNYAAAAAGVDQRPSRGARGGRGGGRGDASRGQNHPPPFGAGPSCKCGIPAVERRVMKEGNNFGKYFYTCTKPRNEQCGFFEWIDGGQSISAPRSSSSGAGRGGRGGKMQHWQPTDSSSVICSRCKQQGHFARSCPNK